MENPNKELEPFTPTTLRIYAKQAEDLRCQALFDTDDPVNLMAEQQFLTALAYLELAVRYFTIAALILEKKE